MSKRQNILNNAIAAVDGGEYTGICLACGEISEESVEPDAEDYSCSNCGEDRVYGAEQIVIMFG